jgi:pimeloyl-ACP methyl ester carboxylesterase
VELPDGRELAWSEVGEEAGFPVFGFHGTPGSARMMLLDHATFVSMNVRFIVPDRPGYGHSTFHHGRRLADWSSDVAALADHLRISRFAVLGISGGGPHAAVCARFLPGRVTAAAIVSGVAPLGQPGSEKGAMLFNRMMFKLARRASFLVRLAFAPMVAMGRRFPDKMLPMLAKGAPPADALILRRPDVVAALRSEFIHASHTTSRAAAQDFHLFARDWGFALEEIAVPVHVWQGDQDINVPPAHASILASRIPGARLHLVPGGGHQMFIGCMSEILKALQNSTVPENTRKTSTVRAQ